jgi:hypothetical protein
MSNFGNGCHTLFFLIAMGSSGIMTGRMLFGPTLRPAQRGEHRAYQSSDQTQLSRKRDGAALCGEA